jgi:hypothetical protein
MRIRALLTLSALIACGVGACNSSAATLFTTTAHTARVTIGATAVATGTNIDLTSGTALINHCAHSALNMTLAQNNDTTVVGTFAGGSFNGCNNPITPTFVQNGAPTAWVLTISGTSTLINDQRCWQTQLHDVTWDLLGGLYSGTLSGMTSCQPTSGSPLTIKLLSSGTISGPLIGNGRYDGSYIFTSTASAWSLT